MLNCLEVTKSQLATFLGKIYLKMMNTPRTLRKTPEKYPDIYIYRKYWMEKILQRKILVDGALGIELGFRLGKGSGVGIGVGAKVGVDVMLRKKGQLNLLFLLKIKIYSKTTQ